MHSSTIATILKQVESNLEFQGDAKKKTNGSSVTVSEVCDKFVEQTSFFEDAIVREQVFQLRTTHTMCNTELKKL